MGLFTSKVEKMSPGQVLADASVVDFVATMGTSIARAQRALDENSLAVAMEMSRTTPDFSDKSLLELGLVPPFYHVVEAELEVKMTLTMRVENEIGLDLGFEIGSGKGVGSSAGSNGQAAGDDLVVDVTVAGGAANDKVELHVGGTTTPLTLVTDTPTGRQFLKGATDEDTAENLKVAAAAVAGVTATRTDAIVTLTLENTGAVRAPSGWALAPTGPEVDHVITTVAGQPGQTVTVDDGTARKTFEVGTSVASGHIAVANHADPTLLATNLEAAITAAFGNLAVSTDGADLTVRTPANGLVAADPFAVASSAAASEPEPKKAPEPKKKKQAIAWGVSVNAHYHRRYEMEVTGSSRVTWKIVSLPPPIQFMEELQALDEGS